MRLTPTRDELLAVVDCFELSPPDRRATDGLVETVASSKKATRAELILESPGDGLSAERNSRALGAGRTSLVSGPITGKAGEKLDGEAA